jgi:hypothetical protein
MNDVITRLAAANPVPTDTALTEVSEPSRRRRWPALAIALAAIVAVPTAAFAGKLGDLFGMSNQGTPEATSSLYLSQDSAMNEAMVGLDFPSTLQDLGTVNGVTFWASRRTDGHYCFAIGKDGNRGEISCDLEGVFPSPATPVWVFPPYDGVNGYAADGVATVKGLDTSGNTVVSVPVTSNVFASSEGNYRNVATVEAFDGQGNQIWSWHLPDR